MALTNAPDSAMRHSLGALYDWLDTLRTEFNLLEAQVDANVVGTADTLSTGAEAVDVTLTAYKTVITTGGTAGNETANIGDGTGVTVGERKLIRLGTRTDASDAVVMDHANMSQGSDTLTGVTLNEEGEFILLEWQGAKWEILVASSGVVAV